MAREVKRNFLFLQRLMWNHFLLLLLVLRPRPLRSPQRLLPPSRTRSALSKPSYYIL